MGAGLFIHSYAGIANLDLDVSHVNMIAGSILDRTDHVFGGDEQLSACGHGIARIHGNVEDDLVEMGLIDDHASIGAQVKVHFDVFADHARQHAGQFANGLV